MTPSRFQEIKEDSSRGTLTWDDQKEMVRWMTKARAEMMALVRVSDKGGEIDDIVDNMLALTKRSE